MTLPSFSPDPNNINSLILGAEPLAGTVESQQLQHASALLDAQQEGVPCRWPLGCSCGLKRKSCHEFSNHSA